MGRWEPGSPSRLEGAALEAFAELGYEQTTVAEIAARAGLTPRTFFRHYADKREVLFAGGSALQEVMVEGAMTAPPSMSPIEVVAAGLAAGAAILEKRRDYARTRQAVIAATAELRERELIKLEAIATGLAESLHRRGVADPAATLTAQVGMAVFRTAYDRWVQPTNRSRLVLLLSRGFEQLSQLTQGLPAQ